MASNDGKEGDNVGDSDDLDGGRKRESPTMMVGKNIFDVIFVGMKSCSYI